MQRELSRTLILYRERKKLTKEEAVWFLGTSRNIVDSYESGNLQYMEPGIVESWLRDYGAPQEVIDDAKAKARWIRQGNPAIWHESAPEGFARFIQIEPLAKAIDIYEDAFVTGLLQTPDYATAVLGINLELDQVQQRDAHGSRMSRQDTVFNRPGGPPKIRTIMSEVALLKFRDTEIFNPQVEHLVRMNQLDGLEIFIVPIGVMHPSWGRSYRIMSFIDTRRILRWFTRRTSSAGTTRLTRRRLVSVVGFSMPRSRWCWG